MSLAILVGGDQRLDQAHDRAVDRAMAYVEKHFAVTRQRRNGSIEQVPTGNLLYAKTVHGTSRHGDGTRTSIDLQAMQSQRKLKLDAFEPRNLEVRSGEALTWERSAADRGIRTGDRFTVERIDGDRWTIRTSTGEAQELRSSDPALRFVSYAYAETADRSQGSTYESVVAVLASTQGEAANQARAYVQVSRTAGKLTFVTDNLTQLARALDRQTGVNTVASHELASLVRASEISPVVELGKTEAAAPRVDRDDAKEKGFDKDRGFSREEHSL